jgi:hypothetical protein
MNKTPSIVSAPAPLSVPVNFPDGLNGNFTITHNKGRLVRMVEIRFMKNDANDAAGITGRRLALPVDTHAEDNNSFVVNGIIQEAFTLWYK